MLYYFYKIKLIIKYFVKLKLLNSLKKTSLLLFLKLIFLIKYIFLTLSL